jgi:hypothetical protein
MGAAAVLAVVVALPVVQPARLAATLQDDGWSTATATATVTTAVPMLVVAAIRVHPFKRCSWKICVAPFAWTCCANRTRFRAATTCALSALNETPSSTTTSARSVLVKSCLPGGAP